MTELLVRASDLLLGLVDAAPDDVSALAAELKRLETECDSVVGRTINCLDESAEPPFARDDITHLIKSLDDIMDWIERFANRFVMYHAWIDDQGRRQILELAQVVKHSCVKVGDAVGCLKKQRRQVDGHCVAIHKFETQGDTIHHRALQQGVGRVGSSLDEIRSALAQARDERARTPEQNLDLLERVVGLVEMAFRFNNLRELLKSLERASDASDTVAVTLRRMVMNNA